MKVGLFLTYDYSIQTWEDSGTLEKELFIYSKIYENYGIKFIIFSYGFEIDKKIVSNLDPKFTEGIEIVPIYSLYKYRKSKYLRFIKSFFIFKELKKYMKEIDIIQQHQLYGSWVSILSSKVYKKPIYIRTGYDTLLFSIIENKKKTKVYFNFLLTKYSLRLSNLYSVTSQQDYKFLSDKFKKNDSKIVVRENWVMSVKSKKIKYRNKNEILSVGRLVDQKNFRLLISEFKNFNMNLNFTIIGKGSEKNNLLNFAKEVNINLDIIDGLPNNKIIEMMKERVFYISTSKIEGNPKTILEAMSCGCIVLASDIPAHRELISNKITGFLFQIDNESLLQTFINILNNDKLLDYVSSEASKFVNENYNLELIASKYFEDYQMLNI